MIKYKTIQLNISVCKKNIYYMFTLYITADDGNFCLTLSSKISTTATTSNSHLNPKIIQHTIYRQNSKE